MDKLYYGLLHEIFIKGGVSIENALPLVAVQKCWDHGWIKERERKLVLTIKGKYALFDELNAKRDADGRVEHADIFLMVHLAERTGDGYDGHPFSVSNTTAQSMFSNLLMSKLIRASDVSTAYDYLVIEFQDPVTDKVVKLFPDDIIVYNPELGYVVHNFREDE